MNFRRYVITAGHCHLPNSRNKRISQVVLGDWDLSQDPDCNFSSCKSAQKFDITNKDVTVQEGFDISTTVTVGNDIALIRLPRLATTFLEDVDQTVIPACLGWNNNIQVPKKSAIVAGWGRTTNNRYDRGDYGFAGVFSSVLKKVEANIRPASVCERTFPSFNRQKQICAGGEIFGQDSCSGDSGGPLLASDGNDFKSTKYIVGVVSYGTLECGTVSTILLF